MVHKVLPGALILPMLASGQRPKQRPLRHPGIAASGHCGIRALRHPGTAAHADIAACQAPWTAGIEAQHGLAPGPIYHTLA
jgi:hypothetical protein